ncbi:MAG: NTE family protein [Dokdonia sp.]|jgi:NTE family protein
MSLGIVFSGGGMKGVAHIGVIKALEEFKIKPTHIAGTSAGAIVGGLYAQGIPWQEIVYFFKNTDIFSLKRYASRKPGFIDSLKFYDDLLAFFPNDSFEDLQLPLYITATDIIKGESHIFNKGELILPLLASASFPGVFTPVKINNNYYIDGGVINDFPTEILKNTCESIIGVYVNPLSTIEITSIKHSYQVLRRAYEINLHHHAKQKFQLCNLLISSETLSQYGTFSTKNIDQIFNIGYQWAVKELEKNAHILTRIMH